MTEKVKNQPKVKEVKKFAVIRTGGKQFLVSEEDIIEIELLESEEGEKINFDEVLLLADGEKVEVGTPLVDKAKVIATNMGPVKGDKEIIFKYKAKKNYRVKTGHRQKYLKVKIEKIEVK